MHYKLKRPNINEPFTFVASTLSADTTARIEIHHGFASRKFEFSFAVHLTQRSKEEYLSEQLDNLDAQESVHIRVQEAARSTVS